MLAKVGSSVQSFRQQHPRYFTASIAGAALVALVWLAGPSQDSIRQRYASYGYPPSGNGQFGVAETQPVGAGDNAYPAFGPRNLKTAVARAEQLWQTHVVKRTAFIKEKGGLESMRMFSDKSWRGYGQMYTLWDMFLPSWPCMWEVERIGRMGDGGKFTCGLPRLAQTRGKDLVVFSIGVEKESSWEYEVLERTDANIYMFDFSVDEYGPQLQAAPASISSRAHFNKVGFGARDEKVGGNQFWTLRTMMKHAGVDWIDILKVDCEGCEFQNLPQVIGDFGDGNLPFGQLLMEIHAEKTANAYKTEQLGAWWTLLEKAGLRAFNSELNYPAIHWLQFPTAMEMNFINNCNGKAQCGTLVRD